jgi:hypothetical protein
MQLFRIAAHPDPTWFTHAGRGLQAVAPSGSFDLAPIELRMFFGEEECGLPHKEHSVPLFLNLSPKLILATASAHPDTGSTVPVAFQLRKK